MTQILLFAALREAAGTKRTTSNKPTVEEILQDLTQRYGETFEQLLPYCVVFNGNERVDTKSTIELGDELAILPPASGG